MMVNDDNNIDCDDTLNGGKLRDITSVKMKMLLWGV